MKRNIQAFSLLLTAIGLLFLLELIGVSSLVKRSLLGYGLMFYGVFSVYFLFGSGHKGLLFIAAALFLLGVLFFVDSEYELLNLHGAFLPSALFILGGGLFVLFLDNPKELSFLISSVVLFLIGYLSFDLADSFFIFKYSNQLGLLLIDALPLLLILSGIIILLDQRGR